MEPLGPLHRRCPQSPARRLALRSRRPGHRPRADRLVRPRGRRALNRLGHFLLGKALARRPLPRPLPDERRLPLRLKGRGPVTRPRKRAVLRRGRLRKHGTSQLDDGRLSGFRRGVSGRGRRRARELVPIHEGGRAGSLRAHPPGVRCSRQHLRGGRHGRFAAPMRVNAQEDQSGAIAELLLEFRIESTAISIVNVCSAGAVADSVGYMEAVVAAGCTRIRASMTFGGTPASDSWAQSAQPTFLNLFNLCRNAEPVGAVIERRIAVVPAVERGRRRFCLPPRRCSASRP